MFAGLKKKIEEERARQNENVVPALPNTFSPKKGLNNIQGRTEVRSSHTTDGSDFESDGATESHSQRKTPPSLLNKPVDVHQLSSKHAYVLAASPVSPKASGLASALSAELSSMSSDTTHANDTNGCNEGGNMAQALEESHQTVKSLQKELHSLQDQLQRDKEMSAKESNIEFQKLKNQIEQMNSSLIEKDGMIVCLTSEVDILRGKLEGENLTGDDKVASIIKQRDQLEGKLGECMEELKEVKSRWSEKITGLEQQVSNLTNRLADECSEYNRKEKSLEKQLEELNCLKDKNEEDLAATCQHLEEKQEKMALEKKDGEEIVMRLQSHISKLEAQLVLDRDKADSEIHKLRCEHTDQLEKLIEMEGKLSAVEDECTKLRNDVAVKDKELRTVSRDALQKDREINRVQKECVQLSCQIEEYKSKLKQSEKQVSSMERELGESFIIKEKELADALAAEVEKSAQIEREWRERVEEIEQQREHLDVEFTNISKTLVETEQEKDDLLLRNAELSQLRESLKKSRDEDAQDYEKHLKRLMSEIDDLNESLREKDEKVVELEHEVVGMSDTCQRVATLKVELEALEQQLVDKNRTIKIQQQRHQELKKTLQKELRLHNSSLSNLDGYVEPVIPGQAVRSPSSTSPPAQVVGGGGEQSSCLPPSHNACTNHTAALASDSKLTTGSDVDAGGAATLELSPSAHSEHRLGVVTREDVAEDINFKYLKHVILRFIVSTEKEAQHLVRAVSTLLHFTADEERLARDTLEWKMSWWGGTKPEVSIVSRSPGGPHSPTSLYMGYQHHHMNNTHHKPQRRH